MFQQMKKRIKNEKGLTLVELLAVIVILGIIAAIAIPAIGGIIDNSRYKATKADAINVINAANLYFADTGETEVEISVLKSGNYVETLGNIPSAATTDKVEKNSDGVAELTTSEIDYKGKNKLTFTGATIAEINAHTDKTVTVVGTTTAP